MSQISSWDWSTGKRMVSDIGQWRQAYSWVEEPYASPDGESVAAIVKVDEMAFSVCENGSAWDNTFDKIWLLRYGPDNRAAALVADTAMWTVAVSGTPWENWFEFVWDTRFGSSGS